MQNPRIFSRPSPGGLFNLRGFMQRPKPSDSSRRRLTDKELDQLSKRVILPSLPVSDEEMARATHQDSGQKLARQDRWSDLGARIRYADTSRLRTPAGETASLLLAFGARSDIVSAAEDALHDGATPSPEAMEALEEVLEEEAGDYACAMVVALAHLDIAWAWHCIRFESDPHQSLSQAQTHLARAEEILSPHDGIALNAPSLLAAQCALSATREKSGPQLTDEYLRLITLDPHGQGHMRALGRHMARQIHQYPTALEVAARRAASLTDPIWQSGGYSWVYLDALLSQPEALELLDPEFFIEGMEQIISTQKDQHIINQFAAFCAIAMAPKTDTGDEKPHQQETRLLLHACLDWIVADHLQELHPLIWSQTLLAPSQVPSLPSRRALVVKGRQTALRIIATRFAAEIADGSSIAFSPQGMYRLPAI